MNKQVVCVLLFALLLVSCGTAAVEETQPADISVETAYELHQNGTFFLDVRSADEWNDFHAPNTTLIPLDELPNRLGELPKDQLIVVVCRAGGRSQKGRDLLLDAGFTHVTSMTGGLEAWVANGYPIATGP
jgi:rhodanese-related sulfurtransferase